jgi:hypothetical protein
MISATSGNSLIRSWSPDMQVVYASTSLITIVVGTLLALALGAYSRVSAGARFPGPRAAATRARWITTECTVYDR